jgi:hypothetical protein
MGFPNTVNTRQHFSRGLRRLFDTLDNFNTNSASFLAHLEKLPNPPSVEDTDLLTSLIKSLGYYAGGFRLLAELANERNDPNRDITASNARAIAARIDHRRNQYARRLLALTPHGGLPN